MRKPKPEGEALILPGLGHSDSMVSRTPAELPNHRLYSRFQKSTSTASPVVDDSLQKRGTSIAVTFDSWGSFPHIFSVTEWPGLAVTEKVVN
jgi:hypothetical protein